LHSCFKALSVVGWRGKFNVIQKFGTLGKEKQAVRRIKNRAVEAQCVNSEFQYKLKSINQKNTLY
jgi:hypothetical protein